MQPKVAGGMLGGAFVTIMIWGISATFGVAVPGEVGAAMTTIVGTGIAWWVKETGAEIPVVAPTPAEPPAQEDEPPK